MTLRRASWICAAALLLAVTPAHALIVLDDIRVPVKVTDIYGKVVEQEIAVSLFHESSSPKPRPLLVLNHGRSATLAGNSKTSAKDYASQARWLAGFGFIVAVPVRVGYGITGGPDVEYSGECRARNYPPIYQAAADQTLAVLAVLRQREDAAKDRAVVMGQSFGGATAVALAAMNPPGIQGAINFAGGGGGRPDTHPHQPCSPTRLKSLFEGYGKTARMPTLWLYSENDKYWGPKLPVEWFEAFRAAGGAGEFVALPPVPDEEGHRAFSRAVPHWQPRVREFLGALGFRPLQASVSTFSGRPVAEGLSPIHDGFRGMIFGSMGRP
jgi:dienelactone hydrolase